MQSGRGRGNIGRTSTAEVDGDQKGSWERWK